MKRLYRSRTERRIWGVCGGLAGYLDIDPAIVRVIAVISIFFSGLGILAYILMTIVIPLEN
jgi:phage shock protein C